REGEHHDQVAPVAPLGQGGPDDAQHEDQPDQQAEEQPGLPDPTEVQVLPALMSPVEGGSVGQPAVDAQVLADQRADDDRDQPGEEQVPPEPLSAGLDAADQGADEESGGQPRGRDPEEAELEVPRARQAVWQPS